MKAKTFDCVEMKRKGADRIYRMLKGKSLEAQATHWRERSQEMRQWLKEKHRHDE